MNVQPLSSNDFSFKAKMHHNTIKQIGDSLLNSNMPPENRMRGLERLKSNIAKLADLGDKDTTIAMYFPKDGYFIVSNDKLGISQISYNPELGHQTKDINAQFVTLLSKPDIRNAEGRLFNQYMTDMQQKEGLGPMEVLQDLRNKGGFSEEYVGEDGIFTKLARYKHEAMQFADINKAEQAKVNEEISSFVKSMIPDPDNTRNLL